MPPWPRFAETVRGAGRIGRVRALSLQRVADRYQHTQFKGPGTAGEPSLYNRDVLTFLPFQMSAHSWVAPTYVMTRDVTHVARPGGGANRFDLPEEPYQLTIGGVNGRRATVGLYDPITNKRAPARIVTRRRNSITIELLATDAPRMLSITDG